jgi:hypothetical protein
MTKFIQLFYTVLKEKNGGYPFTGEDVGGEGDTIWGRLGRIIHGGYP